MGIYAQQGFAKGDKINKGIQSGILAGVVISPKNEGSQKSLTYISELKKRHPEITVFFDTQSYVLALPEKRKEGKLEEYPYYRKMADERFLSNPKNLNKYVSDVVDYERALEIDDWVSPTLFIHGFDSRQAQIAIQLAYGFLSEADEGKRIWISLCVDENSFNSFDAMNTFLDDISMLDVHGFYLIIGCNCTQSRPLAYVEDSILTNYLYFCWVLAEVNGYELTIGYSDLVSVLLFAAGVDNVATGWFNSQKAFDEKSFIPTSGGSRPRPRYTSAPFMSPVVITPILLGIHNEYDKLNEVLSGTKYDEIIIDKPDGSTWGEETSCLHNWEVLHKLEKKVKEAGAVKLRIEYVNSRINHALELYKKFQDLPWDQRSSSSHLLEWQKALNALKEIV
jgi:hypothetical protein